MRLNGLTSRDCDLDLKQQHQVEPGDAIAVHQRIYRRREPVETTGRARRLLVNSFTIDG